MEERWSRLACEAAVSGALRFADYRPGQTPYWHLKEQLILSTLEDQLVAAQDALAHAWHCAAAQSNPWDESGKEFEYHRKEAANAYTAIGRLRLPWYKGWSDESEKLAELWRAFKAQEQDPEFMREREAIKAAMRAKIEDTQREVEWLVEHTAHRAAQLKVKEGARRGRLRR